MTDTALTLPEAYEFSPGQIQLRRVLEIVQANGGRREDIIEALRQEYFADSAVRQPDPLKRLEVQRTLASNVTIGLRAYRLVDPSTWQLTPLGASLLQAADDQARAAEFARHILANLHGSKVIEAVASVRARGERPTKPSIARELGSMGFALPRATTYHTKLLQWLREAGVLDERYVVNDERLQQLLGFSSTDLARISGLTTEQRCFVRTLRRMATVSGLQPVRAGDVIDAAIQQFGPIFEREDQLRAQVFRPLETAGLLTLQDVGPGRGGKSGEVVPTQLLLNLADEQLEAHLGIPPELRTLLATPLTQILADLDSRDTYIRGVALELLAIRMAFDLTLTPTKFRERSASTNGAEVDLISEAAHLHYSRWLFQCKNTGSVSVSDLAKEVGMAVMLRAHVIVLVTTGRFASTVFEHAKGLAEGQILQVVFVDGTLVTEYCAKGRRVLLEHFRSSAQQTLQLKRKQVP